MTYSKSWLYTMQHFVKKKKSLMDFSRQSDNGLQVIDLIVIYFVSININRLGKLKINFLLITRFIRLMNLPTEVNTRAMEIRHQHPGLSYNDIGRAGK